MRKCAKCGKPINGDDHHIIPKKGWEGKDILPDGKPGRISLCKKYHDIIHLLLMAEVGRWLKKDNIELWEKYRREFIKFTEEWLKNGRT